MPPPADDAENESSFIAFRFKEDLMRKAAQFNPTNGICRRIHMTGCPACGDASKSRLEILLKQLSEIRINFGKKIDRCSIIIGSRRMMNQLIARSHTLHASSGL